MKALLLLLITIFGSLGTHRTNTPPHRANSGAIRAYTLTVIGDSLSAGVGASSTQTRYANVLSGLVSSWQNKPVYLTIDALGGSTAGSSLPRLKTDGIARSNSDMLVVELGTNDSTDWGHLQSRTADYNALLDHARAESPNAVLVCTDAWRAYDANPPGGTITDFDNMIKQSCEAHGGRFVDITHLVAVPGNLWSGDNYHPSDQGHSQIAAAIMAGIK